jgi:hypothetical protein
MFRSLSVATIAAITFVCAPALLACGDKYVVPVRGTLLQRAPLDRRAGILVYTARPDLSRLLRNLDVVKALEKVGYRPHEVRTPADLTLALATGTWDVVLVSGADAADAHARLSGAIPPTVLPVLENPGSAEWSAAKRAYTVVIKAPVKRQAFLDAVDRAVEQRAEALRKAARRG